MNRILLIFFTLLFFGTGILRAQKLDSLSTNSEEFYQQLSTILLNTSSKRMQEKSEVLLPRFYERWNMGRFNKTEKDEIRRLVESMRSRGMRTYPYLYDYVYSLTLLSESHLLPKSIIAWHAFAIRLLDEKNAIPFSDFMEFTRNLLEKDLFYQKKSLFWYHRQEKYSFVLDTNFLLIYERLNLVCATTKDSSVIVGTSGVFNYNAQTWSGREGKVTWSRFGEEEDKAIYATFDSYSIDLNHANYEADSARLYYKRFFDRPILGQFSEMVKSSPANSRTSYPRFQSYRTDFSLAKVYPDIDFYGGFELKGLALYGLGSPDQKPYLTLHHKDTIFGKIRAELFLFSEDKLESVDAEAIFYFDQDSLYHPKLRFRYVGSDQQMVLFSEDTNDDLIPFFDSYHQLDIYVQALFWKMNEENMIFKRIRGVNTENAAYFVSSNYYSARDFYKIQGIDEINPLDVVQNYMEAYGQKEISLNALAEYMNKPLEQVSAMLIHLSNKGFLVYNSAEHIAVVKDRLIYFLDAKAGRTDYDVIHLESNVVARPNATINLNDLSLNVFGVPEVFISDSQEVYIYPYDKSISFKKNRDFTFDGRVHMGYLDFYARNSTFVYDSFMLNMSYVDSLAFTIFTRDSLSRIDSLFRLKNVITDLNGKIYIDQPFNKSGLKQFPQFPSFVSKDESYVYFNKKSIQDSTLLADSFYYRVDPFVFDSISTFTTEGLSFDGALVSADIFPVIRDPLVVMPDYSLGFVHQTPKEGYGIYKSKGTFSNEISISNEGFVGAGELKYLTVKTKSDQFIFYPDSLIATSHEFYMKESPDVYDFPSVQGDTVDIAWLIDTNVMQISHYENPFIVYANSILEGELYASPKVLRADGSFHFDRSEISSHDIRFKSHLLTADSSDFYLRDETGNQLVFKSLGYYAKIDFDQHKGWFRHLYDKSFMEFPFNKYIATLDEAEWLMNEDQLILKSDLAHSYSALDSLSDFDLIDYTLSGPEFISNKEDQDSLRFFAGRATYNLTKYTIDVENVRMIKVADAAIFPNNGVIKILRDAGLSTLINARIITDTIHKYHTIYNADVDIYGRHQYQAKGSIDYTDRNQARQPIYLSSIFVNDQGASMGSGTINKDDIFFLSPEYFYSGEVGMLATEPYLRFMGGYKINEVCTNMLDNWVKFDKYVDPNNIFFEISDSTKDLYGKHASFGLAFSQERISFYPLLGQATDSPADFLLTDAVGSIVFDVETNTYKVGSDARLQRRDMQDDYVALNNQRCVLLGDGILNMGIDFSMLRMKAAGSFRHLLIPDSTYLNTSLLLDFHYDAKALSMMTDSLRIAKLPNVNIAESSFPLFLKKILGSERGGKLINELSLYGQFRKIPQELNHTILFTDLKLKWDRNSRSYISQGPIGVGYLGGEAVNKYVDGYVQIENSRSGSAIHIFLRINEAQWYFFSYKMGIMQVISSDNALNDYITELKPEKRILNNSSDENYYEFLISTRRKSTDFVREMGGIMK